MQRKFRISVEGRAYDVVVEEIGHDGAVVPFGSGHTAGPVVAAAAAVAAPAPAQAKSVAAAGDEIAPLAGTVQSIDVTVGQTVKVGDKIATIEAMKMKTEVFAKGAGKVAAIAVKPGDSVDTGGVLLTLA
jgi:glutaconyl-CoA/methylmalonyl-CoA decarboxylase subunit gamma